MRAEMRVDPDQTPHQAYAQALLYRIKVLEDNLEDAARAIEHRMLDCDRALLAREWRRVLRKQDQVALAPVSTPDS